MNRFMHFSTIYLPPSTILVSLKRTRRDRMAQRVVDQVLEEVRKKLHVPSPSLYDAVFCVEAAYRDLDFLRKKFEERGGKRGYLLVVSPRGRMFPVCSRWELRMTAYWAFSDRPSRDKLYEMAERFWTEGKSCPAVQRSWLCDWAVVEGVIARIPRSAAFCDSLTKSELEWLQREKWLR